MLLTTYRDFIVLTLSKHTKRDAPVLSVGGCGTKWRTIKNFFKKNKQTFETKTAAHLGPLESIPFLVTCLRLFIETCFIMFSVARQHLITQSTVTPNYSRAKQQFCASNRTFLHAAGTGLKNPRSSKTFKTSDVHKGQFGLTEICIHSNKLWSTRTVEQRMSPRGFISQVWSEQEDIRGLGVGQTSHNMNSGDCVGVEQHRLNQLLTGASAALKAPMCLLL